MNRRDNEKHLRCPSCMGSHIAAPNGDPNVDDIYMCFSCGEISLEAHHQPGLRIPSKTERVDAENRMQSAHMFWRLIPAASNPAIGESNE